MSLARTAILGICVAFLCWSGARAYAQQPAPWTLVERAKLEFLPQEAFFLVENAGNTLRLKAVQFEGPSPEADGSKNWIFGARAHIAAQAISVSYSLVVVGPHLEFYFTPLRNIDAARVGEFSQGVDDLREEVLQQKKVISSFAVQVQAQDEAIRRLREDAELIANFGRVFEVRDTIAQTNSDIEAAGKDLETLQLLLKRISSGGIAAPRNVALREQQLTQQLRELAEAARAAETAEPTRRGGQQSDLQSKLALVESTRFDDLDELNAELVALQKERATLEAGR